MILQKMTARLIPLIVEKHIKSWNLPCKEEVPAFFYSNRSFVSIFYWSRPGARNDQIKCASSGERGVITAFLGYGIAGLRF